MSTSSNKSNKNKFDICHITPGTEFMWKVSQHIKWFIRHRIKHSLAWQKLTIIYSGVEVPGMFLYTYSLTHSLTYLLTHFR